MPFVEFLNTGQLHEKRYGTSVMLVPFVEFPGHTEFCKSFAITCKSPDREFRKILPSSCKCLTNNSRLRKKCQGWLTTWNVCVRT